MVDRDDFCIWGNENPHAFEEHERDPPKENIPVLRSCVIDQMTFIRKTQTLDILILMPFQKF